MWPYVFGIISLHELSNLQELQGIGIIDHLIKHNNEEVYFVHNITTNSHTDTDDMCYFRRRVIIN